MNRRHRTLLIGTLALLAGYVLSAVLLLPIVQAQDDGETDRLIIQLQAEGPLTPAMISYIQRGLEKAQNENAQALILQLDTGGVTMFDAAHTTIVRQ